MFAVIDSVKAGAVSDSNLTKIREIRPRARDGAQAERAWLNAMMDADEDGRDQRDFLGAADLKASPARSSRRGEVLSAEGQYARFTLLPETPAA